MNTIDTLRNVIKILNMLTVTGKKDATILVASMNDIEHVVKELSAVQSAEE